VYRSHTWGTTLPQTVNDTRTSADADLRLSEIHPGWSLFVPARTVGLPTMAAMIRAVLAILLLLSTLCAQAACFEQAGRRYGIAPSLLKAISAVESGFNPRARNRNRGGSEDLGHMQINSRWLATLSSHGIGREQLFDPCTSTHVGAWILAQNIRRLGYGWEAVGAYNARSPEKRAAYARKVAAKVEAWRS